MSSAGEFYWRNTPLSLYSTYHNEHEATLVFCRPRSFESSLGCSRPLPRRIPEPEYLLVRRLPQGGGQELRKSQAAARLILVGVY